MTAKHPKEVINQRKQQGKQSEHSCVLCSMLTCQPIKLTVCSMLVLLFFCWMNAATRLLSQKKYNHSTASLVFELCALQLHDQQHKICEYRV
jgi:hypothetical protein